MNTKNTREVLGSLCINIKKFLSAIEPKVSMNNRQKRIYFETVYPTDIEFRHFIFNTLKKKGYTVAMIDNDIIYIILDGFKMPVITSFNMEDNIYEPGKVECSVWINEVMKEPV